MSRENVYLLVTDLHLKDGGVMEARYDYGREMSHVLNKLVEIIVKEKEKGRNVSLILMGDVYHNSYKSLFEGISSNNIFVSLRRFVDKIYSVIGNHELTYYSDNPFWTLFKEINSDKIKGILNRVWQPVGFMNTIEVVDEFVDGDVRFILNHYGTGIARPRLDGKTTIGLFHTDLYSKALVEDMRFNKGLDIYEHNPVYFDNTGVLKGYDYAFLGHLHMIYGKWDFKCPVTDYSTRMYYLASLGRTKHTEVIDTFLERNIPAVVVRDGKFVGVEDNLFDLLPREQCVDEELVKRNRVVYETRKERDSVAQYVPIVDDPIENIKHSLVDSAAMLKMFEELTKVNTTSFELDVLKEEEELRWI